MAGATDLRSRDSEMRSRPATEDGYTEHAICRQYIHPRTSIATASVTVHEQGVVIRQHLRRKFIPWQAVCEIYSIPRGPLPLSTVGLLVATDIKYVEKRKRLVGVS